MPSRHDASRKRKRKPETVDGTLTTRDSNQPGTSGTTDLGKGVRLTSKARANPSMLPLPAQRGDASIGAKSGARELQTKRRKLAYRPGTVRVQVESPGLALDRLFSRESTADQEGDVDAIGITRRAVAQRLDVGVTRCVGQRLTWSVVGRVRPARAVSVERRPGEIDAGRRTEAHRERGQAARIDRPWCLR